MKITLTEDAMLEKWRLLRAAEPLRLDCTLGRTDGVDISAIYRAEMRAWYLELLDCGALELLAPVDVAPQASVGRIGGLTVVTAPADVRRVLSLQFSDRPFPLIPAGTPDNIRARASNPFCRRPGAAAINSHTILACGVTGSLEKLLCAVDHGPHVYSFDDVALKTIISHEP